MNSISENDRAVLLVGEQGIGKSSLINDRLKTTCGGDISDVFYISINCNRSLSLFESSKTIVHAEVRSRKRPSACLEPK